MSVNVYTTIRCHRYKEQILIICLSRVKKYNAFNDVMYSEFIQALRGASQDDAVKAVVLTGDGTFFSSGADLTDPANDFTPKLNSSRDTLNRPAGQFMMEVLSFPKLLIAAVNGPAVGIAVTLLLHCDIVYLAPKATLWAPFSRLALVPEFCSSVTIAERCGLSKAYELLLLGAKIDANTAERWNLCSSIIDTSENITDPFHSQSLAIKVCNRIEKNLCSLPLFGETSNVFVSLMRRKREAYLKRVCKEELVQLDKRFDSGDCKKAALSLSFGKRSKL